MFTSVTKDGHRWTPLTRRDRATHACNEESWIGGMGVVTFPVLSASSHGDDVTFTCRKEKLT